MTEWRTTPAEELAERLASANADRHRLEVLLQEAVADIELLGDAGAAVVAVLRKTIYSPADFSGPSVWWLAESKQALKKWEAACAVAGTTKAR